MPRKTPSLVTTDPPRSSRLRSFFVIFGLLLAGAVVFAAGFPNPWLRFGFFPAAFLALVPVVLAVRRMRWWASPFYGAIYGFVTYALFNYWLANFHPLAIFIVPTIYATYFLLLFPMLLVADRWGGRFAWILQLLLWIAYEYLRTRGYLGYAYGIIGYTAWRAPILTQIAELGGVWLVSALVVWPAFFGTHYLLARDYRAAAWTRRYGGWSAYGVAVALTIGFGLIAQVDYGAAPQRRVALVQQNVDPWVGGVRAYRRSLEVLIRQTDLALQEDPDLVVWSETSFVPSIDYHTRYREDQERYQLVRELTDYLAKQRVPIVFGNSDGRLRRNPQGALERADYNAVLVYNNGSLVDVYRKIHLVPFTEHFPYQRQFPWLHRMLVENETTFWEAGTEYTIFEVDGVRFATPICFEDTFGYLSREFVRRGAELIVNLTNDSWAFSEASAMQHLAMAVFRSIENRRSMVRGTNGGMTAIIDPNGRVLQLYPSFVEGYMIGQVPIFTDRETLYTRWGDWVAFFAIIGSVGGLVACASAAALQRRRSLTKKEHP